MKHSNRSPLWRLPVDREVAEEMETHLEMRTREYMEEGLDESEARRRAEQRFGDRHRHAADCRRLAAGRNRRWRWVGLFQDVAQEAILAIRQLRRRPFYAASLIGLLALGLGSTTAVTGLVVDALLQPPPYDEPDRIITVWEAHLKRGTTKNMVSPSNFMAFKEGVPAFENLSAFLTVAANLTGEGPPQRVTSRWVTEGYFETFGVAPRLGRAFASDAGNGEFAKEVILSHGLWQQRFGGESEIVGAIIQLDGESHEVVGVMPAGFGLEMGAAFAPYGSRPDLYRPLPLMEPWRAPKGRWMMLAGRLSEDIGLEIAQAQLEAVMTQQFEKHRDFNHGWSVVAIPLTEYLREPMRKPLLALFGAVVLVLMIVCINASNLLIGRTLGRMDELQVRNALGAGGFRLGRQLLVEGTVVAVSAGLLGWLFAAGWLQAARAGMPSEWMLDGALQLPLGQLWWPATVLTLGCAIFFGLLPLLPVSRRLARLGAAPRTSESKSLGRLRSGLVFGQMVLALVLLMGAGLMLRTVRSIVEVDPGFDKSGVLSFAVSPRGLEQEQLFSFYNELSERLRALPGALEVGAVSHLPMASTGAATFFFASDRAEPEPSQAPVADIRLVRGQYFRAMGIHLLEGRGFEAQDGPNSLGVALVSRQLADRLWPDQSALGKQITVGWGEGGPREIVGVVEDVHHATLQAGARDAIYFPQVQEPQPQMTMVIRGDGPLVDGRGSEQMGLVIHELVGRMAPDLAVFDLQTVRAVVEASVLRERFLSRMLTLFAGLALFLTAMGIYSTAALGVRERRREIGVRMALGASPAQIMAQWLDRTARLTALAMATGVGLSWFLGRSLETLLFGVKVADPFTLGITTVLLGATALLAAALPARSASRLDPTVPLREE